MADEGVQGVLAEMREAVGWCREGASLPGGRRTVSAERVEHWAERIGAAHAREVAELRVVDISGSHPESGETCPNGNGTCPESPTAELREWASYFTGPYKSNERQLNEIADRMDEAFAALGEHSENQRRELGRLEGVLNRWHWDSGDGVHGTIMRADKAARRVEARADALVKRLAEVRAERNLYLSMLRDARDEWVAETERADATINSLLRGGEPMTDENMAKAGWTRLPKDAEGEVIHLGDVLEIDRGGSTDIGEVTDIHLQEGKCAVSIGFEYDSGLTAYPENFRHHNPNPSPFDAVRERFGVRAGDGSLISTVIDACEGVAGE